MSAYARHGSTTIAVAHDWLVRYAGSERVVEQILCEFPGSRLLTTIVDAARIPESLRLAESSFLDSLPASHHKHEWFLPLMPLAWRTRDPVDEVDAVIASSHACANAVRVADGIPLISYCHTPMRYAWDFESEEGRFPAIVRPAARGAMRAFRSWDRRTARRVTQFVANSRAVADRIASFYGRSSLVVHPPVRTEYFTTGGERGDAFLYVGRLTGYKRPDIVVEAFRDLPFELDVVGEGPLRDRLERVASPNVRFLGTVPDGELRRLYRSAKAFVYPVDEDFGITMAEAQACGTPVLGLASGGAVDIVEPGRTGWLVERQDPAALRRAVRWVASQSFSSSEIRASALRFSEERFRQAIRQVIEDVVAEGTRRRRTT